MKILQLCKKFPYPLKDGEVIAIHNLSKALDQLGCQITLLCMNTSKHYFDTSQLPTALSHYQSIHHVNVDNQLKIKDAFLNLFTSDSYHISRFVSASFTEKLIHLLQENKYDVVQMETLYLAPYIPTIKKYSDALIAMRAHNVEHEIWERIAINTSFLPKRWYVSYLSGKLKRFEIQQLQNYDILIPITQKDLAKYESLGFNNQSVLMPIGIDESTYQADYSSYEKDLSISFIGSLDWMPNQEGLQWFINNAWTEILNSYPDLQLHIAGRNTPNWFRQLAQQNVKVHGEVPDARAFINQHSIMIVPLLSGSGMRVKILEGMALGKIVLTTSIGLEGIPATHRENILIADTPAEFLSCIRFCYDNKSQLNEIGEKAKTFIRKEYENTALARKLIDVYKSSTHNIDS